MRKYTAPEVANLFQSYCLIINSSIGLSQEIGRVQEIKRRGDIADESKLVSLAQHYLMCAKAYEQLFDTEELRTITGAKSLEGLAIKAREIVKPPIRN